MTSSYILALDQGTTSSRSLIVDARGHVLFQAQKEFTQHYPKPGWVEHDPREIWSSQWATIQDVLAKVDSGTKAIAGIGITNQRETALVWDRLTGEPIYPAIVWQDRRTGDYCDALKSDSTIKDQIQSSTGLMVDAYFSASKIRWILNHVEGARERAETGELLFGTVDSWLVWKLSNGASHITDASNASRTMLFNIHTLQWDDSLCALFGIPMAMLPKVVDSSGQLAEATCFDHPIPISGIAGDQQSALFGQQCLSRGMVKNTYGTGCFMLMNTGKQAVRSHHSLLTTIAWKIGDDVHYALEGSVFIAGAAVQWLRDELCFIDDAAEIEALASSVQDSDGVYVVPAFAGLGAPHWNPHARGSIFGMTRGSGKGHIARAVLESIAFQSMDLLECMQKDSKMAISEVRVDGGAANNSMLMQFQSDALGIDIVRPQNTETTAMGAAYLAGLGCGFWSDMDALTASWERRDTFKPAENSRSMDAKIHGWKRAIAASALWANDEGIDEDASNDHSNPFSS